MAGQLLVRKGVGGTPLRTNVGATLLTTKLQILTGTSPRRPSIALSILTGRVSEQLSILENFYAQDPVVASPPREAPTPIRLPLPPRYRPRTVYLSEDNLRDIACIIDAWRQVDPRRLTRSAVLRRAVEHLRTAVEADPAKFLLEND